MSFTTTSPTYNIPVRSSRRLINAFDPESSSPFLRIPDDNLILHDSNPIMEQKSSHSSHDEDDALRVPLDQVQKTFK